MSATFLQLAEGLALEAVRAVTADSRRVRPGDVFVAVRGHASDGHRHLEAAVRAGARVVVVARDAAIPAALEPPGPDAVGGPESADAVAVYRADDTRAGGVVEIVFPGVGGRNGG